MQKPGGLSTYYCDGIATEVETSTCSHCQRITDIPSRRKMHEHVDVCRGCMKLICLQCAGRPCITWMQKMEAYEQRQHLLRDMGL